VNQAKKIFSVALGVPLQLQERDVGRFDSKHPQPLPRRGRKHANHPSGIVGRRRSDADVLHVQAVFAMQFCSQARQRFDVVVRRLC